MTKSAVNSHRAYCGHLVELYSEKSIMFALTSSDSSSFSGVESNQSKSDMFRPCIDERISTAQMMKLHKRHRSGKVRIENPSSSSE